MFEGATDFNKNLNLWTLTAAANAANGFNNMFKSATNYAHNLCGWNAQLNAAANPNTDMFAGTKCPTKTFAATDGGGIVTGDICCSCDSADQPTNTVICALAT